MPLKTIPKKQKAGASAGAAIPAQKVAAQKQPSGLAFLQKGMNIPPIDKNTHIFM